VLRNSARVVSEKAQWRANARKVGHWKSTQVERNKRDENFL
jgi:hypothetical protein